MRIGIFGGSFDPPHNYHSYIINVSVSQLALDRFIIIPVKRQPFKDAGTTASGEMRMAMLRSIGCDFAEISDIELKREGISYTVDTLEHLKGLGELVLIIGADSAYDLDRWKDHEKLISMAEIAVFPRNGYSFEMLEKKWGDRFRYIDADMTDVSSTMIRDMISAGGDITGLVPKGVLEIIKKKGLYGWPKNQ